MVEGFDLLSKSVKDVRQRPKQSKNMKEKQNDGVEKRQRVDDWEPVVGCQQS
jgi:hypothetical protein